MGNNNTLNRTKIEKLGLANKCIELKTKGLGSLRISRMLNEMQNESVVNPTNVDNFFKSLKNVTQQTKAMTVGLNNAVKQSEHQLLAKWDKVDDVLNEVLEKTRELTKKIKERDENFSEDDSIKLLQVNLKLTKDIIAEAAKISETRARVLGQITSGGNTYYSINIENQYNSLKQLVIEAEPKFPGINAYVQQQLHKMNPTDSPPRKQV